MIKFNLNEYFTDAFAFYAVHHQNKINRIIHFITIPLIIMCTLALITYIPATIKIDNDTHVFDVNIIVFIVIMLYSCLYMLVDFIAGVIFCVGIFSFTLLINLCVYNVPLFWILIIGLLVQSWILQILGHYYFEHNRPAFLTSFVQSFLVAPLYVLLELLFMCHYNQRLELEIQNKMTLYQAMV
jgi:uncharacterized membrane protein YGL010W